MVKRRYAAVGVDPSLVCSHSFRASGTTAHMAAGGSIETAAEIAEHASTETTKLYDRTARVVSRSELSGSDSEREDVSMETQDDAEPAAQATIDRVGRTWADLVACSEFGPKVDKALSELLDWGAEQTKAGADRVGALLHRVRAVLDRKSVEPIPVPARVGLEILSNVAREEREELHSLWVNLLVSAASGQAVDAFYIDLVRKLDSDSAEVLGVVAEAEKEAVLRYPWDEEGGGGGDGSGEAPGTGDGEGYGDGVRSVFEPLENRARFVAEAVAEGRRPGSGGEAVARLLALGLVEREAIARQLCMTPAGVKLLELVCLEEGGASS